MYKVPAFIMSALLFLPTIAFSAESMSMGSALLKMLWALLIVAGLILVIYAIGRKRMGMGQMQKGVIKIIELRHIMPKSTLALVEVRGRQLLLGIGGGRIELLADVSAQTKEEVQKNFDAILAEEK